MFDGAEGDDVGGVMSATTKTENNVFATVAFVLAGVVEVRVFAV